MAIQYLTEFAFDDDTPEDGVVAVTYGDTVYYTYNDAGVLSLSFSAENTTDPAADTQLFWDFDGDGGGSFVIDTSFDPGTYVVAPSFVLTGADGQNYIYRADGNIYDLADHDVGDHDLDLASFTFTVLGDAPPPPPPPTDYPVVTGLSFADADGGAAHVMAGDMLDILYSATGDYTTGIVALNADATTTPSGFIDFDGGGSESFAVLASWQPGAYSVYSIGLSYDAGWVFFGPDISGDGVPDVYDATDTDIGDHALDLAAMRFVVVALSVEETDGDGQFAEGETLTASFDHGGALDGTAISYQWLRDGAEIRRETGETYIASRKDAGAALSVRVTYTDETGATETHVSAPMTEAASTGGGDGGGGGGGGRGRPGTATALTADSFLFTAATTPETGGPLPEPAASRDLPALAHMPETALDHLTGDDTPLPTFLDDLFG